MYCKQGGEKTMNNAFRVIFVDHDKKTFGISLLMCDDTNITNKIAELQEQGRNVNCQVSHENPEVIQHHFEEKGYQFDKYILVGM